AKAMTHPLRSTGHYPASALQRNRLSAAARFRRGGNDLRAFHSLWVGKAGGELLRGSPPLSGASVLSASRLEPLVPCMGLFLSRSFGTPAHLLHQFLCSIRKPFLRPDPRFAHVASLLTTAACGGLRSAPDCRPRRTFLHLSYLRTAV